MKKAMLNFSKNLLSKPQMKEVKGGTEECYRISCGEGNYVVGTIDVTSCSLGESIFNDLCASSWPGSVYDTCSAV